MIVMPVTLHAAWLRTDDPLSSGQLFLWAEDFHPSTNRTESPLNGKNGNGYTQITETEEPQSHSTTVSQSPASQNSASRRQRTIQVPSHPAQVPLSQLRHQLVQQFPALGADTLEPASATLWLPSLFGLPLTRRSILHRQAEVSQHGTSGLTEPTVDNPDLDAPSRHLSRADSFIERDKNGLTSTQDEPYLSAWQITGVSVPADMVLRFLGQLTSTRSAANGQAVLDRLRLGNDLLLWSNAAKFVLEILVGQHYLPSLRIDGAGGLQAVWRPSLLDAQMQERFEQLVLSLPAVCRAYNLEHPTDAPAASTLVEHFVGNWVDSAIRLWSRPASSSLNGNRNQVDGYNSTGFGSEQRGSVGSTNGQHYSATHWLDHLLQDESRLHLPPQPSHELYRMWHLWVEQLQIGNDANFRICFELETPDQLAEESGNGEVSGERVDGHDSAIAQAESDNVADATSDLFEVDSLAASTVAAHTTWRLRYYLQALDNSQLLISAHQIWQTPNNFLRLDDRRLDQPQEKLLAGLGAVSRLFAPIERSLQSQQPEMALLSTAEAYLFLREVAPLLENSGCGVLLPDWWRNRLGGQLALKLRLSGLDDVDFGDEFDADDGQFATQGKSSQIGFNSLVKYRWDLTLGGRRLNEADFEQLTALKTPLLRVHNQWIELEPAQVDAAKGFLSRRTADGSMTLLQALRLTQGMLDEEPVRINTAQIELSELSLPELDALGDTSPATKQIAGANASNLHLDGIDVSGWLQNALAQLRNYQPQNELVEPEGFVGTLRPYQRRGVAWLAYLHRLGLGACLADDMGLGKTVQAIAYHLHVRQTQMFNDEISINGGAVHSFDDTQGANAKKSPTLLICPTSVLANWRREIERFAPGLKTMVHHGNGRLAEQEFLDTAIRHDFIVTSYGTARRDIALIEQIRWQDLILDEAQNIKNPNAKQSQAVRRIRAGYRIALTGTPVENRLSELWSIIDFLNPGYLGGHERFRKQFIVPIERYNNSENTMRLRRLVQPFLLRRLKSDPKIISDLPEKNEAVVYCTLTQEQQQLYEKVVNESLEKLNRSDGIQRRGLVLSLLTKLKQICNHPAHYLKEGKGGNFDPTQLRLRSGKLTRLREMLEEALSVGDQALIFTQFVEMGTLLDKFLRQTLGEEVLFLHGGTTANQRDRMVQMFQEPDGPSIFVLSLRAGGSGLNLTRANHVFHFDRWWNPAVEDQATDRAFRIGQLRNVQVHKFVVAGTLEERIHDIIESKKSLAENIVGSGEDWITELSTDQLRDLLTLRSETLEKNGT